MKKILFLIIFVIFSLSLLFSCRDSGDTDEGGGSTDDVESYSGELCFELSEDGESYSVVRSYNSNYFGDIVIPKTYKGKPVLAIAKNSFLGCSDLLSVRIPEGVTEIGNSAFDGCTSLSELSLPASLRSIGSSAFFGCRSLVSVSFSDGLSEIGDSAFRQCTSLTEVILPESLTTVGASLFSECTSLKKCLFGNKITEIPDPDKSTGHYGLFTDCLALESVTLPKSLKNIPAYSFCGCVKLAEIKLPESLEKISVGAFMSCPSLTSLRIPRSVKNIDSGAIAGCPSLYEIINESDVVLITQSSGWGVKVDAKSIIKSESDSLIKNIDGFVFYMQQDDPILIKYLGDEKELVFPSLANGEKYTLAPYIFTAKNEILSLTLPNDIKKIDKAALGDLICLETLVLNSAEAEIDREYFGPNESIKTVYLNVTNNFELGFFYKLEKLICGEGLIAIPDNMLKGSNCREVEISASVESIGDYAFYQSRLESIIISESSSLRSIGSYAFSNTLITEISLPDGVTEIKEGTFNLCGIKTIDLPKGLKSIGKEAFMNCSIRAIDLPDSLVEIGESAFSHCLNLVKVGVGEESMLESIGDSAFYACENLGAITLPKKVASLGLRMLGGTKVKVIHLSEENPYFTKIDGLIYSKDKTVLMLCPPSKTVGSVTLPKEVKRIAPGAFYAATAITSVSFADGSELEEIGEYAFYGCGITAISLPAGVKLIDEHAFYYCQSLREADISLTSITVLSDGVFADCYSLSSIYISKDVTSIGDRALYYTGITTVTYGGSMAEWESLEKGENWDGGMGDYLDRYSVVCSDGRIDKE